MFCNRFHFYITNLLESFQLNSWFIIGIFLILLSCKDEKPAELVEAEKLLPEIVDFNSHVKPILSDKCFACHGPDLSSQKAGLRLDIEEGARALLGDDRDHAAIVPGKLNKSHVYLKIISDDPEIVMPPPDFHLKLSDLEKATIAKWIEQGATYKPHWSFIKPEKVELPKVSDTSNLRQPIDNFILRKLDKEGLEFSEDATRETLIRRVSFDLIGLPPTLSEIDNFLNDKASNAYEKVIDRLMSSKAYGERMATNWLDVARYADSDGYLDDKHREFSPYRDWVIDAFNSNMPYDKFVTWQLAGDLITNATQESKLATAFNRLNKRNSEAGIVFEEYRVEYTADRTNTVGKAFLGLSFECARCHDHKYDPISQKDYYKMFGFFNSTFEIGTPVYGPDQTPGPALLLTNEQEDKKLDSLKQYIGQLEIKKTEHKKTASGFGKWIKETKPSIDELTKKVEKAEIAHYSFDNFKHLNGTRYSAREKENKSEPATFNQPVIKPGKFGDAFFVSDYNNGALGKKVGWYERTESFSVQLWVYPDTIYRDVNFLWHCEDLRLGLKGYTIKLKDNKPSFIMSHSWPQNALEVTGGEAIPKKKWSQITVTYDGSSKAKGVGIYINGRKQELNIDLDNLYKGILHEPNIHTYGFGGLTFGARGKFIPFKNGGLDEIKVFNRALTPLEVLFSYDKNQAIKTIDANNAESDLFLRDYFTEYVDKEYDLIQKELYSTRDNENKLVNGIAEIMVMGDLPEPRLTYVLNRGVYSAQGEQVEPGTPDKIFKFKENFPKNRLGLSQWLFDKSNPLTSRVFVNRIWQMHFGKGIVNTADDFGSQGSLPSHPELLDWLAIYFQENDWNIKDLHKVILTSKTYRQHSRITEEGLQKDPENILLSRGARYRFPAEMIRDNALAISGLLVHKIGGESVYPYQPKGLWDELTRKGWAYKYLQEPGEGLYRRSLYTIWKRTAPPPSMLIFDIADRGNCIVKRTTTNTPLQALVLLNDPQFVEAARVLAEKLIRDESDMEKRLQKAFRIITSRLPERKELATIHNFYQEELRNFTENKNSAENFLSTGYKEWDHKLDPVEIAALGVVVNAIMNTDEAITNK